MRLPLALLAGLILSTSAVMADDAPRQGSGVLSISGQRGNISALPPSAITGLPAALSAATSAGNITSGTLSPSRLPVNVPNGVPQLDGNSLLPSSRLPAITSYLDTLATTRGAMLFRGSSGWSAMSPCTNGYVIASGGPGADPTCVPQATGSGGGSVTAVTAGSGLTGGTITNTGSISLASPTASVLGGILSAVGGTHQFQNGVSTFGAPTFAQPSASDVSGLSPSATMPLNVPNGLPQLDQNGLLQSSTLPAVGYQGMASAFQRDVKSLRSLGAIGDGASHPISGVASFLGTNTTGWSLSQWQAILPAAKALTDELDGLVMQQALNAGWLQLPVGGFRLSCALTVSNHTAKVEGRGRGQSVIAFSGIGSSINNSSGVIALRRCNGQSITLSGSALAKLGLTAGTYTNDFSGAALTIGGGAVAVAHSPLNTLSTPMAAGDTLVVNGTTISFVAASQAVAAEQISIDDQLWRVVDEIDTITCNGIAFCVKNTDANGPFDVFNADNFEIDAPANTSPAGRLFDIVYPPLTSFGYQQASVTRIHSVSGSVGASFRSFMKVANVWFTALRDNYFTGTADNPCNCGSYFYQFAGGSGTAGFGTIGAEISGEYFNADAGAIATGYAEGIHFAQRTEFVGCSICLSVPSTVKAGGVGGVFAAQAWWWDNLELNAVMTGADISKMNNAQGTFHTSGWNGQANWTGLICRICVSSRFEFLAENGNAGSIGFQVFGGHDNRFTMVGNSLSTQFVMDSTTADNTVNGQAFGGNPNTYTNSSASSVVNWKQHGSTTILH